MFCLTKKKNPRTIHSFWWQRGDPVYSFVFCGRTYPCSVLTFVLKLKKNYISKSLRPEIMADSPDEEVELIFVRDDNDEQLYNNTEL